MDENFVFLGSTFYSKSSEKKQCEVNPRKKNENQL